jgi:hypothetical protein
MVNFLFNSVTCNGVIGQSICYSCVCHNYTLGPIWEATLTLSIIYLCSRTEHAIMLLCLSTYTCE